jgi:hypothetical protein
LVEGWYLVGIAQVVLVGRVADSEASGSVERTEVAFEGKWVP